MYLTGLPTHRTTPCFLSALMLGEIRKRVEKLADTQRRQKLGLWLEHDLRDWFCPRILPIGPDVADH